MTAKISKWGNSQGLRVPKDIMDTLNLNIGDNVDIKIENGKVIIEAIKKDRPKYNLNELISQVPNNYKVNEEFTEKIGKEEW
ncbi:transcriptional regulator/antitoxin, MazE [Arcobacter nitrofigilis DSM 7299]|uniref:Transcriptional regulator/antitoxin, MazE n=1 Tax=Arcobacter nitrofigilis (strain ATCC 33309 / DSM 7299 / CCUG 15893 / LMG 7604 / NCTC 12251 / CI) TaxID=572480 RepID=D5V5G1_ARCNC|nr:AbrB/MazE/SpoVT family DNA-binding domain-containing protein [Arcobacter nitrofigilis]ADG93096.1 transcriptional regulator/antitoxin, MazE [Arcobacter nitrofigilis DSM 7299]